MNNKESIFPVLPIGGEVRGGRIAQFNVISGVIGYDIFRAANKTAEAFIKFMQLTGMIADKQAEQNQGEK